MIRVEVLGLPAHLAAGARLVPRLRTALGALAGRATRVRLRLVDDNGPKGGVATRCALSVKLPGRAVIHVEAVATTPALAFDAALARLERGLARARLASREGRRHPKKYYAARLARG